MQLPSIVIPIADNQMEVANTLDEQNLAIKAYWSKNSQLQTMKQTIKSFLSQDCKELRNSLKDLNITPTGADIVANEIISYKGSNAR
jgi:spore coat polysaccharide biosynthesis predicted glycosyltransferase SpsG